MSDPIVTHADLPDLERVRDAIANRSSERTLLDRLIAVAKADAPPLPEGWVLAERQGPHRVLWHKDAILHTHDNCTGGAWYKQTFESVTPLRPTVTEADVERAAEAAYTTSYPDAEWDVAHPAAHTRWRGIARAAFAAAGVEVQS